MKTRPTIAAFAVVAVMSFCGGLAARAAKKNPVDPSVFRGKEPAQAAEALLSIARAQAGDGTWERIAVGRVLYLAGKKPEGQEIFNSVLHGKKVEAGDWMRIGRVYYEAGEWELAKPLFSKVLGAAPKDEDWHAEIGAYYLLQGDRDTAEELFTRSFELDPENLHNTLRAAAAYSGLPPRE